MTALLQAATFSILVICMTCCSATGDRPIPYTRSSFYLDLFAKTEIEFVRQLNGSLSLRLEGFPQDLALEYVNKFQENTVKLRGYAPNLSLVQKAAVITSNSFSIYQLIHRWVNHLTPLRERLQSKPDILDESLKQHYHGFTKADLNESMTDILLVLHVHVFDVPMAIDGVLGDLNIGTKLSADQCFQIGNYARGIFYHALSIQFLEVALIKSNSLSEKEEIERSLNKTIKEHDSLVRNGELHPLEKQYLFDRRIAPLVKRYGRERQKFFRIYQRVLIPQTPLNKIPPTSHGIQLQNYPHANDICRYKNLQTDEEKSLLFCWYESSIDPYFQINPLKMELLSAKPELVQIYGLLPQRIVQLTKEVAVETSRRNPTDPGLIVTHRIETVSEYEPLRFLPIEPRILSSFKAWGPKNVPKINILLSTPGSMFYLHSDLIYNATVKSEVVTFLYYIEEPEMGGETYFILPRVSVKPVAGSAIIWISSLHGGGIDHEMTHGGCPVVLGRKAVASKYARLNWKAPRKNHYAYGKSKHFPKSKVLNQKLYPKLKEYLKNKDYAGNDANL